MGRKPQDEGFQAGHQAGRDPQTDQRPPQDQLPQTITDREQRGARGGEYQQHALDLVGAEPVEQDAEGQLKGRKGQKVNTGQQPQGGGIQPQGRLQFRRQYRIDGSVEVGQKIAGGKG